jgi:hypothetical protein
MNHLPYIDLPSDSNIYLDNVANISNDSSNTPITSFGGRINVKGLDFYEKEGIIVFLDALGIKGIWQKEDPKNVINRWGIVLDEFHELEKKGLNLNVYGFSDTIIITCAKVKDDILYTLNLLCELLIPCFIKSIKNRIFLRGSITYGKFFESTKISIGEAIDECARLHNNFEWIGLSFLFRTSNLTSVLAYLNKNYLINYNHLPYKGHNNHYNANVCVNWPLHDENQNCLSILIKEQMDNSNNPSVYIKYVNTIRFYNWTIQNSAKL